MGYADETTEKRRVLETEKQDSAELQQKYKVKNILFILLKLTLFQIYNFSILRNLYSLNIFI